MDASPASPRDTWMAVLLALAAPAVVVLTAVTTMPAMRVAYGITAVVLAALLAGVVLGRVERAVSRAVLLGIGIGCYLTGLATLGSRDLDDAGLAFFGFRGTVLVSGVAFLALRPQRALALGMALTGIAAAALLHAGVPPVGPDDVHLGVLEASALSAAAVAMLRALGGRAEVSQRAVEEVREIADLAFLDDLTGLPNRRQGTVHLRAALLRAVEGGGPESLVLFDLDHFKQVNDTHGHDAGDDVLRVVARIASAALRPGDVLCRWGGEEFLVLLTGADADYAAACAERCRAAIAAWEGPHRLTASYGVTGIHPADTVTDALRRADLALYEAKAMGRNQVRVHHRRTSQIGSR